jgi:hypothetical protein
VAIGGVTGLVISFLLLPASAHPQVVTAAARTLDQMADALRDLLAGLTRGLDVDALHRIQDGIGEALVHMNIVGAEAERERSTRLAAGPDTGPLLRTLLRLRHDLVIVGRAATTPLPEGLASRLRSPLALIGRSFADYLHGNATALRAARQPPSLDAVEIAAQTYAAEIDSVRREGLTHHLSANAAERFFALGFALEQMHSNFKDLDRCVAERAESSAGRSGKKGE